LSWSDLDFFGNQQNASWISSMGWRGNQETGLIISGYRRVLKWQNTVLTFGGVKYLYIFQMLNK
jgi:hypothetical protein